MRKTRKTAGSGFGALRMEGGLIAPAKVEELAASLPGDKDAAAAYGVPKGLTLKDEISRYYRIAQAKFADFAAITTPTYPQTVAFVRDLLKDVFGFPDFTTAATHAIDERTFRVSLEALDGRAPVIVADPGNGLDAASPSLNDGKVRSAALLLQDWLNASDDALWGLASDGFVLRLMRDNASLTRPAYIEADLRQMFEAEDFASFSAFWLLIHASRFGAPGGNPAECALERWREDGAKAGVAARDKLRDGVERALAILGTGFLADNPTLRDRVEKHELTLDAYFQELLRLVYRLIFLFAAEDRELLHPPNAPETAKALYAKGYSLARLRDRAIRRAAWDRHADQWEGVRIVFRALATGEARLALPALGGLFAEDATPTLDAAKLANRALFEAVFRLAYVRDDDTGALSPVNWRDIQTDELGSVYESLLELVPRLLDGGRAFGFAGDAAEQRGNTRKTTGSYYTPDSLVQALLDTALDPVLDQAERDAPNGDKAEALLKLRVIDPACGSGHFLLGAARRMATRVARARAGGVASPADYRHALRDVVRCCIHGVDRNPMAVELAKVALWIETVEPGKPLGFLDANIKCGDSLFGIWDLEALRLGIPDAAFEQLSGDDKDTAKYFRTKLNAAERDGQGRLLFETEGGALPAPPPLADIFTTIAGLPEDTLEQISERKARYAAAMGDPRILAWRDAADLYCAAFLTPKTGGIPATRQAAMIPTTEDVWITIGQRAIPFNRKNTALNLAKGARAFHWPLEFPDVLAPEHGPARGFDLVIGNPPWEVLQLSEEEYFAHRRPEIAELNGAA
ncbi:MAG: Eco57I restriction-modification methylase domain-containing protein, partial [Caulobacterales bacterium]